jgi:hypothetical protein
MVKAFSQNLDLLDFNNVKWTSISLNRKVRLNALIFGKSCLCVLKIYFSLHAYMRRYIMIKKHVIDKAVRFGMRTRILLYIGAKVKCSLMIST